MVIKTRFLRFSKAVFRSLFYLGLLFPAFLFFSSVTIFFTLQCFTLPFLYSPCIKQENHQCLKLFLIALIMFSATMQSVQNMLHNSYGCSLRILFLFFSLCCHTFHFFQNITALAFWAQTFYLCLQFFLWCWGRFLTVPSIHTFLPVMGQTAIFFSGYFTPSSYNLLAIHKSFRIF